MLHLLASQSVLQLLTVSDCVLLQPPAGLNSFEFALRYSPDVITLLEC